MKCQCGAWTEVKETRDTRRTRVCANGHRFRTEEVIVDTTKARRAKPRGEEKRLARDNEIRAMSGRGMIQSDIASAIGCSKGAVWRALKAVAPSATVS